VKISGIIPLRNAVKLGYPFELAIRSMRPLCDEIVVAVDPTSEDDTLTRVRNLPVWVDEIVESPWDLSNHDGLNDEIAKQTAIALERATGDWVLSLQADELLHENEIAVLREAPANAEKQGWTALELARVYFFGSLTRYRSDWTVFLPRLFKRGHWRPDEKSGAMYFVPAVPGVRKAVLSPPKIYHYSRVGDPGMIARRIRNLDTFYHAQDKIQAEHEVAPYTFECRKLDTYVIGYQAEIEPSAEVVDFPLSGHPATALEYFKGFA
jgi:hypothetical protein